MAAKDTSISVEEFYSRVSQPMFNLADEPWITASTPSGVQRVGLRELFVRSHELTDVVARTDIDRFALLRLLGAFASDLPSAVWSGDTCDPALVAEYFDSVHDRLWLFHPTDPFAQQAELAERAAIGRSEAPTNSIRQVVMDLGAATHTWWEHPTPAEQREGMSVPHAEAAQLLVTHLLFGTRGNEQDVDRAGARFSQEGLYGYAGGGAGMLLVARQGRTLHETLRANIARDPDRNQGEFRTADLTSTRGALRPCDSLSAFERALWTQKAILLIPDSDGHQVARMFRGSRGAVPAESEKKAHKELLGAISRQVRALCPHTISIRKNGELGVVWADETKAAWRELEAIAATFSDSPETRSIIPSHALQHARDPRVRNTFVETLGCFYAGNAANPVLAGWSRSSIPSGFLTDADIAYSLATQIRFDGVIGSGARDIERFARMAWFPRVDANGKITADRTAPISPRIADELAAFWAEAEGFAAELAAHLASHAAGDEPDGWSARVTAAVDGHVHRLLDEAARANPARRVAVEAVRAQFEGVRRSRLKETNR